MTSRETEILRSNEADIEAIAKAWAKMINEVQKNGQTNVQDDEQWKSDDKRFSVRSQVFDKNTGKVLKMLLFLIRMRLMENHRASGGTFYIRT